MRIVRFQTQKEAPMFGWLNQDNIGRIDGSTFGEFHRSEAIIPLESVQLLAPVVPGKIICVGRNYAEHIRETNAEIPTTPLIFLKPPSSVIGPNQTIFMPPQSMQVDHEAELVVVIGKRGRWIQPSEANSHIFG